MNVYDFDKTIYAGDSTVDFYLYCLRRRPGLAVYAPRQGWGILLRAAGRLDTGEMKGRFFSFLAGLDDPQAFAEEFWQARQGRIRRWYLARREDTDVIISASPAFLLAPVCRMLGLAEPIATEVDLRTGALLGPNCKGEEKVRRFYARCPGGVIERFYSDSHSDDPLARLAGQAFLVKGEDLMPWE